MPVTPKQGLPFPANSAPPNVPVDIQALALAAEGKLNMWFSNAAARDAAVTAPSTGMNCYIEATKEYQLYSNTMWNTIWTGDFGPTIPRMSSLLSYENRTGRPASTREGTLGLDRTRNVIEGYNGAAWKHAGASPVVSTTYSSFGAGVLFAPNNGNTNHQVASFSLGNSLATNIAFSYTANMACYTTAAGEGQLVNNWLEYRAPGASTWVQLQQSLSTWYGAVPINYPTYFHISNTTTATLTGIGTYGLRLWVQNAGGGPVCNIYRINVHATPIISSTVFS